MFQCAYKIGITSVNVNVCVQKDIPVQQKKDQYSGGKKVDSEGKGNQLKG